MKPKLRAFLSPVLEVVHETKDYLVVFSFGNFSAFPSNKNILQMSDTNLCKHV
jgi:hypothetical protein